MADVTNDLLMEGLRAIRSDLGDLKDAHRTTHRRLSSIDHHLAAMNLDVNGHTDELELLRDRVSRIERRLEIAD